MEKLLVKPTEAGESLALGRSTTYLRIARGEIPSVIVGGSVRVPVEALRAWIKRKARERKRAFRPNADRTRGPLEREADLRRRREGKGV